MKSIITGGAGFLGCHLAEYLVKLNHKVIIIDNFSTGRLANLEKIKHKVKIVKSDISRDGSWKKNFKDVDWVFHFASLADIVPSIENPKNYFDSNVNGTLNVLQACRKSKPKKFIYAASSSCYGIAKKYPTPEKAEINPQYPYALTKRLGEELVMHWHKVYKLKAISLRFFNLYGTKSRTDGTYGAMFGIFLGQKLAGLPFTVVGDGNQKRDFTYVSDAVDAIIKAAKCNFCISTATGFDEIPGIFRRPIAYSNLATFGFTINHDEKSLILTKHHISKKFKRRLTVSEIFLSNLALCFKSEEYEKNGIELEENSPEEIRDLVVEMDERLNGCWIEKKEDSSLQKKFWSIYEENVKRMKLSDPSIPKGPLNGKIKSRFGAKFLRENKNWIR